MKDDLTKYRKKKKEKDDKDYINPELAEKHNEQGAALYKEGKSVNIQESSPKP